MDQKVTKIKKINPADEVMQLTPDQPAFPTWFLIIVLIISFFILKFFIYIKDEKRHGR